MILLLRRLMWQQQESKMKLWKNLVSLLCGAAVFFSPATESIQSASAEQKPAINWVRVGGSVIGELYADRDSMKPYTKDGVLYLSLMMQEKFTRPEFLNIMRQTPGLEDLSYSLTLYMFQVKEQRYFIASQFYLDSNELVCLDLGAEKLLRPVSSDPAIRMVFEYALKEARRDSIKTQQGE